MKNEVHRVGNYNFTSGERLLLDANIWLYIHGINDPNSNRTRVYSDALRRILEAKSCIFIDVLITSEFINTFTRIAWKQTTKGCIPFKKFRKSKSFQKIADDVAARVEKVLSMCRPIESGFSSMDLPNVFKDFRCRKPDFNDQVLEDLCKQNNMTFLTDDADFGNLGLKVLTANKRLLKGK